MRSAVTKKTSQEEQKNQTTITTKINYIQKFVHLKKSYYHGQNSVR